MKLLFGKIIACSLALFLSSSASEVNIRKVEASPLSRQVIEQKLRNITIPELEFENITFEEALAILRQKSLEHDTAESDLTKRGVNLFLHSPQKGEKHFAEMKVSLNHHNITLGTALKAITNSVGVRYVIGQKAVMIPARFPTDDRELYTTTFSVSPQQFELLLNRWDQERTGDRAKIHLAPKLLLENYGIAFPPGSSAHFLPENKELVVTNRGGHLTLLGRELNWQIYGK